MEKMMKKMKGMDPKKMMRGGGMENLLKSMGG
jgi:hypothetical protein